MGAHKRRLSKCRVVGEIVEVELINSDSVVVCDKADYLYVSSHRWRLTNSGYAMTYVDRKGVFMHRAIAACPKGLEIDHINHNKMDNRRCNLRIVTRGQNALNQPLRKTNTSGYKGVRPHGKKWQAYIMVNRKMLLLGTYADKEDARKVREVAEKVIHAPILESAIMVE